MKIKDQEVEADKIFLNMTFANVLCTPSTLRLHSKPGINYGPFFFRLKYTVYVLSSPLLRIVGGMHCELGLMSEYCYNVVGNTLILNMTKPGKRVFHFSDLQTVVQQKLLSTIWSLFIETYTCIIPHINAISIIPFLEISFGVFDDFRNFKNFWTILPP